MTPQPVDIEVGRRIHALRRRLGLTRRDLAQEAGVTFQQIQKYEDGQNRISSARLAAIALRLGVSPAALFGETADPAQQAAEIETLLTAFDDIQDPAQRRSLLTVATTMARATGRLPR